MKNLLLTLAILTGFTACNNTPDSTLNQERNIQLLTDSTAYHNDVSSDTSTTVKPKAVPEDVVEKPVAKSKANPQGSSKKITTTTPPANTNSKAPNATTPPATASKQDSVNNTGTANNGTTENSGTTQPEVEKKKGWNKATQGAVIGGAAGAVGGAIISKKKGVGAVVGGIVGAAGGYIIGNKKDKKEKQSEEKQSEEK